MYISYVSIRQHTCESRSHRAHTCHLRKLLVAA